MRKKTPRAETTNDAYPHKSKLDRTGVGGSHEGVPGLRVSPGPLPTFRKATNIQLIFLRRGETIFIQNAFLYWLMDKQKSPQISFTHGRSAGFFLTLSWEFPYCLTKKYQRACARQKILPISSDIKCRLEIWGVSSSSLFLAFSKVKVESPKLKSYRSLSKYLLNIYSVLGTVFDTGIPR